MSKSCCQQLVIRLRKPVSSRRFRPAPVTCQLYAVICTG